MAWKTSSKTSELAVVDSNHILVCNKTYLRKGYRNALLGLPEHMLCSLQTQGHISSDIPEIEHCHTPVRQIYLTNMQVLSTFKSTCRKCHACKFFTHVE